MRNPGGHASWTGPAGMVRECDTFTCCHCNGIVFVGVTMVGQAQPASDFGGFCVKCNAQICGSCADKGVCRPFEAWLDAMEGKIKRAIDREAHDRALERAMSGAPYRGG